MTVLYSDFGRTARDLHFEGTAREAMDLTSPGEIVYQAALALRKNDRERCRLLLDHLSKRVLRNAQEAARREAGL